MKYTAGTKHIESTTSLKQTGLLECVYSSVAGNKVYLWLTRSPVMWPDKCSARAGHLTLLYIWTSIWYLKQFLWWADTTQHTDAPTGRNSEMGYPEYKPHNGQTIELLVDYFHQNYLFRLHCLNTMTIVWKAWTLGPAIVYVNPHIAVRNDPE